MLRCKQFKSYESIITKIISLFFFNNINKLVIFTYQLLRLILYDSLNNTMDILKHLHLYSLQTVIISHLHLTIHGDFNYRRF